MRRSDIESNAFRQFLRSVAIFRGTIGFMSGMYLFLFGPIVHHALVAAQEIAAPVGDDRPWAGMPFELDPLQWTAIMFALGIFLEFLLEIPSGMFADILGRKMAIVTSMIFRFINLGLMFLLIVTEKIGEATGPATVIAIVVIYWIFYSLFFTLQNGAYEAWVKSFLEEERSPESQAWVFAHGENWNNGLFLVGAVIGVFLWSYQLPHLAYLAGMGLSILCACTCGLYLPENRKVDFRGDARARSKWSEVFWNSVSELSNRRLMVVFFMNAAATSLIYLINLSLFIFFKNHFFAQEGEVLSPDDSRLPADGLRWWSVGTTFALAFMTLLGNLVFSRWLKGRLRTAQGLGIRALVWINAGFNLCLALPVLAASAIFGNPETARGQSLLLTLMALMVVHKLAASTYRVAVMTLQNDLIPEGKRETATILSLGATMKNVVIVFLIVLGVGKEPASLLSWVWPALAVLAGTAAMLMFVRDTSDSPELTESEIAAVPVRD